MSAIELKPCPFCGAKPAMRTFGGSDERNGYNTSLALSCKCGASVETETKNSGGLPEESVAAAKRRLTPAWNTRAALTPPEGYVLVPVEPTEAMLEAAGKVVFREAGQQWDIATGYPEQFVIDVQRQCHAAMLAARPEVL